MLLRAHRLALTPCLIFGLLAACGDGDELDPAQDAGISGEPDMGVRDLGGPDAGPDGSGDAGPDGGPDAGLEDVGLPDAGRPDMGTPDMGAFACEFPQTVTGVLGEEALISVDTSATDLRPRDLGLLCGNTDSATRWAPQQIIAYEVPGNGPVAVRFSTRNPGTSTLFDTVVQVRRGDCSTPPPFDDGRFPAPSCFEDASENLQQPDFRSEGAVQANGGETLFFVITGFSDGQVPQLEDQGPVTLTITPTANEPPTLNEATPFVVGPDVFIRLDGDDPEGNVRGAILNFRIGGQVVDIYGAGTADPDVSAIVFDDRPGEVSNHIRRPQIPFFLLSAPPPGVEGIFELDAATVGLNPSVGTFMQNAGIEQLGIRVYDDAYATSQERIADVVYNPQRVGLGEGCASALCEEDLVCEAGFCSPSPLVLAACDPMNVVDSGLSSTSTVSQLMVTVPGGPGAFDAPSCVADGSAEGAEAVISVEVPQTGRFDLLASTDTALTNDRDTIIHLREDCFDAGSEVTGACSDDISADLVTSEIEVLDLAPGAYTLVVEQFRTSPRTQPVDLGVDLRLRPIVGDGEACDPAGLGSRCDVGSCQGDPGMATCQP